MASSESLFGANANGATCLHPFCSKRPTYGVVEADGARTAQFCAPHAKTGMVNVSKRRCAEPGCPKHPSFTLKGDKSLCYCVDHATDGMVRERASFCRRPRAFVISPISLAALPAMVGSVA